MTAQIKNYPFEVVIAGASPSAVPGRSGQKPRLAEGAGKTQRDEVELAEVRAKIRSLIG